MDVECKFCKQAVPVVITFNRLKDHKIPGTIFACEAVQCAAVDAVRSADREAVEQYIQSGQPLDSKLVRKGGLFQQAASDKRIEAKPEPTAANDDDDEVMWWKKD